MQGRRSDGRPCCHCNLFRGSGYTSPMALKLRFHDLRAELRRRHEALWESLLLLEPAEWETPPGRRAAELLAATIRRDEALLAAVEAAAVGLPEVMTAPTLDLADDPEALLQQSLDLAAQLDARLAALDNHQWQRKWRRERVSVTLADLVDAANDALQQAQGVVDAYLGSFARLGKEGLQAWLRLSYDELMDSVAGMREEAIRGSAWYGAWNTFQVLEHVWAWNEQLLETARRWHEESPLPPLRDLPRYGEYNPYVGRVYTGDDMVVLADGLVTVYRQTVAFIARCDPGLLTRVRPSPWPGLLPLSNLVFEVYRHAWQHAQAIRTYREQSELNPGNAPDRPRGGHPTAS